jgi:hypothetical protein
MVPRELNIFQLPLLAPTISHLGARYTHPFPQIPTPVYQKRKRKKETFPQPISVEPARNLRAGTDRPPPAASPCESAPQAGHLQRNPARPWPLARSEAPLDAGRPTAESDLRFAAHPPARRRWPVHRRGLPGQRPDTSRPPARCRRLPARQNPVRPTPPANSAAQPRPPDAAHSFFQRWSSATFKQPRRSLQGTKLANPKASDQI